MQCSSYVNVCRERDLNSWHIFDSNANNGEVKGNDISLPLYNMEQGSSYDKEMLRQIIQNQDVMFRYQVQELHRLYKKQKELMDEMRDRKIFTQHSQWQTSESIHSFSHARSNIYQATNWLRSPPSKLSELTSSQNIHPLPKFIAPNHFGERVALNVGPSMVKGEFKLLSSRTNNGNENRIIDLELSADVLRFKNKNNYEASKLTSNSPEKLPNFLPAADSVTDSVKIGDLSSFDVNNRKSCCLFDLNVPIPIESLPSSSNCPMETYPNIRNDSGFLNCDGSSDGINSLVFMDLNSMPDDCFPERETNVENIRTVKMETKEILDGCCDTEVDNKLLKREKDIDLNTDAALNEPSSPTARIKSEHLEGPVSPENEECSPPRGESEENTELEVPSMELETIAAETLVTIFSSGHNNCLFWFAGIVSVAGDDLVNSIMNLKKDASACNDHDNDENALNVEKEEGTGRMLSVMPQKGRSKGMRRRKSSKDVWEIEGYLETSSSKRKTGKRACAKPRKYSKVDKFSNRVEKQMSSTLKHPASQSKEGVLRRWGKVKKREGGLRRKASKFLVIT